MVCLSSLGSTLILAATRNPHSRRRRRSTIAPGRAYVEGAMRAGMRGVLLHRGDSPTPAARELGVPVIRSLRELPGLLTDD